jgi:antagonist of KipI
VAIKIIKPGLLTTIQDSGRYGYQKEGIITSGAMDSLALRIANILVGASEHAAGIEVTQQGPSILFEEGQLIAITGANLSPNIHGLPVPLWRPVWVSKNSLLEFGRPHAGYRAYIAFAGGLAVPQILGSQSTYLRARIGGWNGRALQSGDRIPFRLPYTREVLSQARPHTDGFGEAKWSVSPRLLSFYETNSALRLIKGPEYGLFTDESKQHLWTSSFRVSYQSDRMGYRLQGNSLLLQTPAQMLSSAVSWGSVQVPASGQPIILMADHQTIGGYPRIAHVASADLPRLAQTSPGSTLTFTEVSLAEAQALYINQQKIIDNIKKAIQFKKLL